MLIRQISEAEELNLVANAEDRSPEGANYLSPGQRPTGVNLRHGGRWEAREAGGSL